MKFFAQISLLLASKNVMNPIKTWSLSAAAAAAVAASFRRNYRSLTMIAKLTFQRESLCPTLTTVMSNCLHFKYNLVSEATSKALVASSRTEKRATRRNCYNFALFTPTVSSQLVSFISHYLHREKSIVTTHGYGIQLLQYR